jgi:hypothetical protein
MRWGLFCVAPKIWRACLPFRANLCIGGNAELHGVPRRQNAGKCITFGIVSRIGNQHRYLHDAIQTASSIFVDTSDKRQGISDLFSRGFTAMASVCGIMRRCSSGNEYELARESHARWLARNGTSDETQ